MLWYLELISEFALLLRLALHRDQRPYFEAMLWSDFLTQCLQLLGQRMHWFGWMSHIWYAGVIMQMPLLVLALDEASEYLYIWHKQLLFTWLALTFGCAWIRIYPYTGTALLSINCLAFWFWLYLGIHWKNH